MDCLCQRESREYPVHFEVLAVSCTLTVFSVGQDEDLANRVFKN